LCEDRILKILANKNGKNILMRKKMKKSEAKNPTPLNNKGDTKKKNISKDIKNRNQSKERRSKRNGRINVIQTSRKVEKKKR
jgi:uncharacterized protein YycO